MTVNGPLLVPLPDGLALELQALTTLAAARTPAHTAPRHRLRRLKVTSS